MTFISFSSGFSRGRRYSENSNVKGIYCRQRPQNESEPYEQVFQDERETSSIQKHRRGSSSVEYHKEAVRDINICFADRPEQQPYHQEI